MADQVLLPSYPAALVLQGSAILASDPIRCQTGPGKLMFRYWSNGDIILQTCLIGYGTDKQLIGCIDQSANTGKDSRLAVFDLIRTIKEPFTLNLIPHWTRGVKNRFLVIDEIAYIGECSQFDTNHKSPVQPELQSTTIHGVTVTMSSPSYNLATKEVPVTEDKPTVFRILTNHKTEWTVPKLITLPASRVMNSSMKESYFKKDRYPMRFMSTISKPDNAKERTTWSTTEKASNRWVIRSHTTRHETVQENYCNSLNCNFDENSCNYLNNGLTRKPWTLRNRGYGYPLATNTDIRPVATNGQFVATILDPGDIAILESPKFNAILSLNVLIFQYFRPSHMTTIRLCLGSRYTDILSTVAEFARCPSILRPVTSINMLRWNTVHVQLPPGTTQFFLVAHNSNRSETRFAIALDNMRVAICYPRDTVTDYFDDVGEEQ